MARALADTRRAHPASSSAATSCRRKPQNWSPAAVWKDLRYRTTERWLDERGDDVPAVHALRRRRQHQVLGQRALPAAARGLPARSSTPTASRRPGRSTTTRWRRTTTAPSGCTTCTAQSATIPPSRRAARFPHAAVPHARRHGGHRRAAARAGAAPVAAAARPDRPGRAGRLHALQHLQFVSVPDRTRRATPRSAASAPAVAHANVTLWTNALAQRLVTDADGTRVDGGRGRARRRDASASKRRCSSSRAARSTRRRCCCGRRPTRIRDGLANSSGLVGRRYMAHLATMMQGFHPFRMNDDGVPEDGRDQRLLSARARTRRYPLGQIQSQGRTHGVMAQVVGDTMVPWHSAVGVRRVGRARRGLAGDVRGPAARREPRDGRAPDGRIRLHYRPNNVAAHEQLVRETRRASCAGSASGRSMTHSHRSAEHDAPVRHARASAPIRARRCSIRSAAPTTSRTSSSSTRRSSPRRRR